MDRVPGERRRNAARALVRAFPSLAALAALALGGVLLWRHAALGDAFRIREIRFEGLSRATAEELLELSPVQRGDHLLLCDTDLVAAALRRHPWLTSAEVERELPRTLVVRVSERRAAALVELGGLYLVDAKGEVFKRAVPGDGLDLPVVTGIAREAWIDRREEVEPLLSAALALLARWSERGLDRAEPVSEIHVDPESGTTLWAGDDGLEVRLGHGDLPEKLERLERVLSAVAADRERAQVLHLDNRRRPDWVTVRLAGRRGETGGRLAMSGGSAKGKAETPSPPRGR
ncbi:MAG TPA: FtsQ-type POTRA domain-containing protein [Anaeromyxobacter sp.]